MARLRFHRIAESALSMNLKTSAIKQILTMLRW